MELSEDAALTILLHASKHPSCTVNGVLLGKQRAGGGYLLSTAIPLFHRSHTLAPCVETALSQAEIIAQQEGSLLVGYYHGDYKFASAELGPLAKRIADRICERQPGACVLLLDNVKLATFSGAAAAADGGDDSGSGGDLLSGGGPLELLLRDNQGSGVKGGAWRKVQQQHKDGGGEGSGGLTVGGGGWDAVRKRYLNLFAADKHHEVADFEDHLDDLGRDYLNKGLLEGSELLVR